MTASNDWLQDYLKDAVDRKLCVKYGCTTCGAGEFREGLKRVAIQNSSVPEDAWTTLGQALGQLEPGIGEATRLGDAARLVIMELCGSLGEERTEQLLGDGWASGLFRSMEAHHEAVEHGRRRHIEEQERAQQAKGAQRRLRAEQHAQRLARKALRDAARKASQSEDAARSPTNIIGVDCATEPTKVGLVLARFSGELLVIQEARCGTRTVSPASIVAGWIRSSRRVLLALDAPLGWPAGLSSALQGHSAGSMVPATANEMFRRVTDNEIYRRLGKRPLDVGADRIARTTRAALEFLEKLRGEIDMPIDLAWSPEFASRIGAIEVYPAATRISLGAPPGAGSLKRLTPRFQLERGVRPKSNDERDAIVCAIAAAEFLHGRAVAPVGNQQAVARQEGWIWVGDPQRPPTTPDELAYPKASSLQARPIGSGAEARVARDTAALKYKPKKVRFLLVAEAPPPALERYFFFENVASSDWLFRGVVEVLFGRKPGRRDKAKWLTELKNRGVFLVDLMLDPVDGSELTARVPDLVARCRLLQPERIILIKASVYDAAYQSLKAAGLPVVDKRIPFPSTGHQGEFRLKFGAALKLCGWR